MTVTAVPFYRHQLSSADAASIADVITSPFLTSAGVGRAVQAQMQDFFSVGHAKLTNSWTNGAVATLLALDIGPGDEVIVPAMTFVATANVVELVGATPVLVDVSADTLLINLDQVAGAITPRTRAIIPVHLYGQMVDVAGLRAVVGQDIAIIEDCAHCFEGSLNGQRPGTHSDAAVFSFYATKNVTCGEGGAIITNNDDLAQRIEQTVLHGMSAGADRRFEGAYYRHWDMERMGTKANLPDLLAALLPRQIETVAQARAQRQHLADRYRAAFCEVESVRLVADAGGVSAEHLFVLGVPAQHRDRVLSELNSAGVGTTVNYRAVHRMAYYHAKYALPDNLLPVAALWGDSTLSLPLFPGLREDEQDHVITSFIRIMRGLT